MGNIEPQKEEIERMVKQYNSDPFRKRVIEIIAEIVSRAAPFINIDTFIPDIDPQSKGRIEWWNKKLDEYVKSNYPYLKREAK